VKDAACPISTRGGTRLVRLVRGREGGGWKVAHLKHRDVHRALRGALRHVLRAARAALAARAARARVQRAERGGVVPARSPAR